MRIRPICAAALTAMTIAAPLVQAGTLDSIKNSAGSAMQEKSGDSAGSTAGANGLMGQLAGGSMNLGSPQNAAGVLGYCQEQGYAPSATDTVKSKLMSKVGGQSEAEKSDGYKAGLSGLLKGGDGQSFDLSNVKSRVGKKVCGSIADKAMSSFLGG